MGGSNFDTIMDVEYLYPCIHLWRSNIDSHMYIINTLYFLDAEIFMEL